MATARGTTRTGAAGRAKPLRLPRTTGAVSGLLIIVLGVWAGIIPFIGGYFHYAFGSYQTWHFTDQRLWLSIVPGAVAVIGGFMLLTASSRVGGLTAGWVALAAGAWFVVGPFVSILWHHSVYPIGTPMGGYTRQMLEWIGFFAGSGALIVALAAFAMGRYFSRPRLVEEPAVVAADVAAADAERRDHMTRAAVADAPAERTAVRDVPADRTAVADEPADRAAVAGEPADRTAVADQPADRAGVAGTSTARDPLADAPDTDVRAADARAAETRGTTGAQAADAPTTSIPTDTDPGATSGYAPASTGTASTDTATGTRRSGGLLGRFRR